MWVSVGDMRTPVKPTHLAHLFRSLSGTGVQNSKSKWMDYTQ
jgi:hypothetical protein